LILSVLLQKRLNRSRRHLGRGLGWGKETCIRRGVQIPTHEGAILRGSGRPRTCSDMSGGRYIQSDSAGGSTGTVRMLSRVYAIGGAHWRNLANAIETPVCGGDATLCQITLTTCLIFLLTGGQTERQTENGK